MKKAIDNAQSIMDNSSLCGGNDKSRRLLEWSPSSSRRGIATRQRELGSSKSAGDCRASFPPHRWTVLTVVVLLFAICAPLGAESLYTDTSRPLCADKRARAVGDVLTIIVTESATSTNAASSDATKKQTLATNPGVGPLLKAIPAFGFTGSDQNTVSGTTSRTTNFTANIAVKVTKVLPNGNLEIEGVRDVQTNRENQQMTITGTVRPEDIAPDNTIQSTYVANAKIVNTGAGPMGSRMKEGLIGKLVRILF